MIENASYWIPLCEVVARLRCWVRVAALVNGEVADGHWGQLLIVPVDGYLEASGGPSRVTDVAWVELACTDLYGGIAGRPLRMVDIKDKILAQLDSLPLAWELRRTTWSKEGMFVDEPVEVIRFIT